MPAIVECTDDSQPERSRYRHGRVAGTDALHRPDDARDEPPGRPPGDGTLVRCSNATDHAGRSLVLPEPTRSRGAAVQDHAFEHVAQRGQSLGEPGATPRLRRGPL